MFSYDSRGFSSENLFLNSKYWIIFIYEVCFHVHGHANECKQFNNKIIQNNKLVSLPDEIVWGLSFNIAVAAFSNCNVSCKFGQVAVGAAKLAADSVLVFRFSSIISDTCCCNKQDRMCVKRKNSPYSGKVHDHNKKLQKKDRFSSIYFNFLMHLLAFYREIMESKTYLQKNINWIKVKRNAGASTSTKNTLPGNKSSSDLLNIRYLVT